MGRYALENKPKNHSVSYTFVNDVLWINFSLSQKADIFQYFEYISVGNLTNYHYVFVLRNLAFNKVTEMQNK